jgi:hypothetical protein
MRKTNLFILPLLLITFTLYSCGKKDTAQNEDTSKKEDKTTTTTTSSGTTGDEGVKIVMDLKAGEMGGTMTILREGEKAKATMNQEVQGMKMNNTIYTDGDYAYIIVDMMGQNTATKMKLDKYKDKAPASGNDIDYLAQNWEKYEKVGTETILGKECDIRKIGDGATASVYDGKYPLKFTTKGMTMTATSFETMDVPDSELKVPDNVNFKEVESPNIKNIPKIPGTK